MKRIISVFLTIVIIITMSISASAMNGIPCKPMNLNLSDYEKNLLMNTTFEPYNIENFNKFKDDQIMFIVQDFIIMKKNINKDFTINICSLNEDNMLLEPTQEGDIQTYAITEEYVPLPSGKYTATTYWTVATRGYGQQTTTMYLTPNTANLYIAKNQSSGQTTAIKYLLGLTLLNVPPAAAAYELGITIASILDDNFYYQIAQRSTNEKPVMISISKSNVGKVRYVSDWNGKSIRSRNGTSVNSQITTTEETTIYWSSAR
ncbi:hypothetical protein E4100_08935 [Soehngenia longivitae]|uniref:Uncharacterized protein n=1 Tax=Soehngenia longivitae TaxID=2562294 RepID=A0A4Z0D076_9FIRM|nr:hypothetical protein [Soehngenia longivitae]TFZ39181.1 hypothetical protein E4100_08935 [Soehngenia longivitae]